MATRRRTASEVADEILADSDSGEEYILSESDSDDSDTGSTIARPAGIENKKFFVRFLRPTLFTGGVTRSHFRYESGGLGS